MAEGPSSAEASRLAGGEDLAEFTELDLTGEEYAGAGSRGYVNVSMDIQARPSWNYGGEDVLLLASTYRTRWIKRATLAGWVSIAFVVFLYLASWVAFFTWNRFPVASSSFQGLIVLLSAACVIWRFRAQDSICSPLPDSVEREKASELREQQASVGIGLLLIGLACFAFLLGGVRLAAHVALDTGLVLSLFYIVSFVGFGLLGAWKLVIARELDSVMVFRDGMASVGLAALSAIVLIASMVVTINEAAWWVEAVLFLLTGLSLLVYGGLSISRSGGMEPSFWQVPTQIQSLV